MKRPRITCAHSHTEIKIKYSIIFKEKTMLNINKIIENGNVVLKPEGRLDTVTAPQLEEVIKEIGAATLLTFDLEKLEYISSAGLRVLLSAQKMMNKQGEMKLCNVNDTIMEIFEVTGFSDILTIE